MQLSEPRRKRQCRLKTPVPLPIIRKPDGEIYKFKGKFVGYTVIIEDETEMKQLIAMGYFGKATLSRSFPTFSGRSDQAQIIRKRQFERRKEWGKKFGDKKQSKKCIVVPDSDEEDDENYFVDLRPQYEIDSSGLRETVRLLLEEAFFLHHAVGCLDIFKDKVLSTSECWSYFKNRNKSFVSNYVAYCYFRAKNWVVKPGIKFGGDYLLYKQGPPFYHASYVVIIEVVDEDSRRIENMSRREMNPVHLQGLNRLCETAGKELLICQITWPKGLEDVQVEDISKFEVTEILMRRWLPSVERQIEEYF